MAQGLLAPLLCYQPLMKIPGRRDEDFHQLIDIAEKIDCIVPDYTAYAEDIDGTLRGRYVNRDEVNVVRVIQESRNFDRPKLRSAIESVTRIRLAILVPSISDLFECNDFLVGAMAAMNASYMLQILSLRLPGKNPKLGKLELSRRNIEEAKFKGIGSINSLLKENSAVCFKFSKQKLANRAKKVPEIELFKEFEGWSGGKNIGELYMLLDELDPPSGLPPENAMLPFERKRRRY